MLTPRSRRSTPRVCYKENDSASDDSKSTPRATRSALRTRLNVKQNDSDNKFESVAHHHLKGNKSEPETWVRSPSADDLNPVVLVERLERNLVLNDEGDTKREIFTPRRGSRVRGKTIAKGTEDGYKRSKKSQLNSSDESEGERNTRNIRSLASLFTDDDVEGRKMFGFKVSHKKQDVLKKAIETVLDSPKDVYTVYKSSTPSSAMKSIPSTPKRRGRPPKNATTPKNTKLIQPEKTPHHFRQKMKKKLQTLTKLESEGSDFSDTGSEYLPSDDNNESNNEDIEESNSDESVSSNSDKEERAIKHSRTPVINKESTRVSLRRKKIETDDNFIIKSDNYFSMHGAKKIITSNHTLDRLKNPRITQDKLQSILKNQKMSKEHHSAMKELLEDYEIFFNKWLFVLSEGFNVLLHGVGSKMKLIEQFQHTKLSSYPCIVINGFFPSLTLKDVLDSVIVDLLDFPSAPSNVYDAINLVEETVNSINENIFLIVHNIDGPMLKSNKMQFVLSKLAKIDNINLICSIDNINAPLIWDHVKLRDFNFSWWDVTTYLPYIHETSFESSLLVHKSGVLALSSLSNVFHSLTTNAKSIFMIIAKHQIKNKKTPHYQGMSFKDLYWASRENFLVSSDIALRAQLTEFLDHKLIKNKRTLDGVENLLIPIDNRLLQQFIEKNEEE